MLLCQVITQNHMVLVGMVLVGGDPRYHLVPMPRAIDKDTITTYISI